MPTSKEHAARIRRGLEFTERMNSKEYNHNEQVVFELFYTVLHMFEAAIFDFTPKKGIRHYYLHGDRQAFLGTCVFSPSTSPFAAISADYKSLQELSEQARYLSVAGSPTHQPLRDPEDVRQAWELHQSIRAELERQYANRKIPIPWADEPPLADAGSR